jgi:hypothetical protein
MKKNLKMKFLKYQNISIYLNLLLKKTLLNFYKIVVFKYKTKFLGFF